MDKEEFEERKKEILDRIFISPEEAHNIKDKELTERERICKSIERRSKLLDSALENIENKVGSIMRDFELENPPSKETQEYLNNLWVSLLKEIPERIGVSRESYRREEDRKVNELNKIKTKMMFWEGKYLEAKK